MLQRSKSAQSSKLNRAPLGRPGARASVVSAVVEKQRGIHAITDVQDNAQLMSYERSVKDSFDRIEPVLRQLVAIQFEKKLPNLKFCLVGEITFSLSVTIFQCNF